MADKTYYEKRTNGKFGNTNFIYEINHGNGDVLEYDLIEMSILKHDSGTTLSELYSISKDRFTHLKDEFFKEILGKPSCPSHHVEDGEFILKTRYEVVHNDILAVGYSRRNTIDLIEFLLELKYTKRPLLIADKEGEVTHLIDTSIVQEASFKFKKI